MTWVLDENILEALSQSEVRKEWAENRAFDVFHDIQEKLKEEHRERSRIGALGFKPISGTEGLQAWMVPIEGHPKILGFKNPVQILSVHGETLYEGVWGETPLTLVQNTEEFFVWLPYRHGGAQPEHSWATQIKGFFRFLKNRHRKRRA
ncbi:MAG: hypothetical protein EBQ85_07480 [Proteobacteria bacterium]|nr:hypothetical protein [Pseudomonadota bacterium]